VSFLGRLSAASVKVPNKLEISGAHGVRWLEGAF